MEKTADTNNAVQARSLLSIVERKGDELTMLLIDARGDILAEEGSRQSPRYKNIVSAISKLQSAMALATQAING